MDNVTTPPGDHSQTKDALSNVVGCAVGIAGHSTDAQGNLDLLPETEPRCRETSSQLAPTDRRRRRGEEMDSLDHESGETRRRRSKKTRNFSSDPSLSSHPNPLTDSLAQPRERHSTRRRSVLMKNVPHSTNAVSSCRRRTRRRVARAVTPESSFRQPSRRMCSRPNTGCKGIWKQAR